MPPDWEQEYTALLAQAVVLAQAWQTIRTLADAETRGKGDAAASAILEKRNG